MFTSQIKHYTEKYNTMKGKVSEKVVSNFMNLLQLDDQAVEDGLIANSDVFKNFAFQIAKTIMPGRVASATYVAVVAYLADKYGISYTVNAGFCLPKSSPVFSKELESFNQKKAEGVAHPVFANHVFLTSNAKVYEYFNGETENIEHIDFEAIA